MDEHDPVVVAWLATCSPEARVLAREFPPGTRFEIEGQTWHLIGYTTEDELIVSSIDPREDFDGAHRARGYLSAAQVRENREATDA